MVYLIIVIAYLLIGITLARFWTIEYKVNFKAKYKSEDYLLTLLEVIGWVIVWPIIVLKRIKV